MAWMLRFDLGVAVSATKASGPHRRELLFEARV
jgi:hypothetical protein